ncbi:uncharacterized protein LOC111404595 [Olea europaea var. sylvestris]|uniref:uncharacterized protein LOC111404595 n=1 Tax=Olea europaea var. sylvestris TaxID=158386 RepID=UPI000C1D3270|nr:uncharacterized protein LOC111404595 [Olea europaea var. sylvestris]
MSETNSSNILAIIVNLVGASCGAHTLCIFIALLTSLSSQLYLWHVGIVCLNLLAIIVNLVGTSCKRVYALRVSYHSNILEKLNIGELSSGSGKFQEMSLAHPGDIRWGSHAMYVHCFAHQFQLAVESIARRNCMLGDFFNILDIIVNLVGASCKSVDVLQAIYHSNILEKLNIGELSRGSGQFQEMSLACPGGTRWGSHAMYVYCFAHQLQFAVVSVARGNYALRASYHSSTLEKLNIGDLSGGSGQFQEMSLAHPNDTRWGSHAMNCMLDDFFNILAIIVNLVGTLCKRVDALQASYRSNILGKFNIGELSGGNSRFKKCVHHVQNSRDNGWDTLLSRVIEFRVDRHILVPEMEDIVVVKELIDRFSETITELFTCISSPRDSFAAFDKDKLLRLAQFYPLDFNSEEFLLLRPQLDKFLMLVRMDKAFFNLNSISCVAQKLVETRSFYYFPLVYRLL